MEVAMSGEKRADGGDKQARRVAPSHGVCGWLLVGAVCLGGRLAETAEVGLREENLDETELRYVDESRESLSFREALEQGVISVGDHVIEEEDNYASIIEDGGLRADPNSIDFHRSLNADAYPVRALPPGEVLKVVVSEDPNRLAIVRHPALKGRVVGAQSGLREIRDELRRRAIPPEAVEFQEARDVIGEIVRTVQELEMAGYAVEAPVLEATGEALEYVGEVGRTAADEGRTPTPEELQFMRATLEGVRRANSSARNTDAGRIGVRVKTLVRAKEEEDGFTVCHRPAMKLYLFRAQEGEEADPEWRCDHAFDTVSSPARKRFKAHQRLVVWATRDEARVSEFRVVDVQPNHEDGTYRFDLRVDTE